MSESLDDIGKCWAPGPAARLWTDTKPLRVSHRACLSLFRPSKTSGFDESEIGDLYVVPITAGNLKGKQLFAAPSRTHRCVPGLRLETAPKRASYSGSYCRLLAYFYATHVSP